jgi:hypothetical protein
LDFVIVAILLLWFCVSVACQIRHVNVRRVKAYDLLGLVPAWNFFSPRPVVTDYFVSYRTWGDPSADPSEWRRLMYPGRRRLIDGVLNSRRRLRKAQWDCAQQVLVGFRNSRRPIPISAPAYLRLLGRVSREAAADQTTSVQFKITCVRGFYLKTPTEVGWYLSSRHRL